MLADHVIGDAQARPIEVAVIIALMSADAEFIAALAKIGGSGASPHPSIGRDAATGARHLTMPLPGSETVRRLADALSAIAESLRKTDG
jgi:hypothetical protein